MLCNMSKRSKESNTSPHRTGDIVYKQKGNRALLVRHHHTSTASTIYHGTSMRIVMIQHSLRFPGTTDLTDAEVTHVDIRATTTSYTLTAPVIRHSSDIENVGACKTDKGSWFVSIGTTRANRDRCGICWGRKRPGG